MSDITIQLAPEHQNKSKEELSKLFDEEIERFSQYMSKLGDWRAAGPLADFERTLIKTYLVQKHLGKIDHGT
jgi:hypothetical protein